jgi:DNA-binding NtrC family response regulator
MPEAHSKEETARQVLVVDDDLDFCEVISDELSRAGYRPRACTTAEQALDLLRTSSFHALLTDQVMPRISGLELVRRALSVDPGLRCVVFSGCARPEGVKLPWLQKPFNARDLVAAVKH